LNESESDIDITSDENKRLQQKNIGLQLYANCRPVGRAGFELNSLKSSQPSEHKEVKDTPCPAPMSEAVHDPVHHSAFCQDLQQIIDHWDSLSEHIKAAIKSLIQAHITE
jgi:hypothetical protein